MKRKQTPTIDAPQLRGNYLCPSRFRAWVNLMAGR